MPDFSVLPTPCYVVDERLLTRNLEILDGVQRRTGCKILLALKGFSMFATFPLIGRYLAGVTASSLFEARLGREEMDKEVHIYAPAYRPDDFSGDPGPVRPHHFQFLRPVAAVPRPGRRGQRQQLRNAKRHGRRPAGSNAACVSIPTTRKSRPRFMTLARLSRGWGSPLTAFRRRCSLDPAALAGLDGLHFHAMCEQNSDTLWRDRREIRRAVGALPHAA